MTGIPTRDRIIAAAVTLFARAGFNGVTTKEIAKAANVSDGNSYRYFPTKRDLFLCAFESELQKLSVRAQELAMTANAEDSRTALRTVTELITENMVKQPELVRLLHFSALEFNPDIEPLFRQHLYPIFDALSTHRQRTSRNQDSSDIGHVTTAMFFIASVILLQNFFPSFSGYRSPFDSVESAIASYARLLGPSDFDDSVGRCAACMVAHRA